MIALISFFVAVLATIGNAADPILGCKGLDIDNKSQLLQQFVCGVVMGGTTAEDITKSLACMNSAETACTDGCHWCAFPADTAENVKTLLGAGVCLKGAATDSCDMVSKATEIGAASIVEEKQILPIVSKHYDCLVAFQTKEACENVAGCSAFTLSERYGWPANSVLCLKDSELGDKKASVETMVSVPNEGIAPKRETQDETTEEPDNGGSLKINTFSAMVVSALTAALAYEFVF